MLAKLALTVLLTMLSTAASAGAANATTLVNTIPLARAHAHNDYLHARPLLDALDHGFTSVEADVWLVNGDLLVAHGLRDARSERTLRALYLEPLRRIVAERGGRVYPGYREPLVLLIDIKSDAAATYRALHEQLRGYEAILTVVNASGVRTGPVQVAISGNRPRELMQTQGIRYAGYDGRLSDLTSETPAAFMPLISDNWMGNFRWMGAGPMPDEERAMLRRIVETAHRRGQRVRFWATPDTPGPTRETVWTELLRAEVDYLNTDDLEGLRQFLLRHDPAPSTPYGR